MSPLYYQGIPLNQAQGATPDTLRLIQRCLQQQRTFRTVNTPPGVTGGTDQHHIECTTSGSSGQPKVIRRHIRSWIRSFHVNQQQFGLSHTDHYAVFGDVSHSLTLYGLCEAIHLTLPVTVLSGMRPHAQVATLQQSGITVLYITPTQLRLLTRGKPVLPAVRLILCGGSKLDQKLLRQALDCFPSATIHEFYGASETSFITLSGPDTPSGSVGKAYPKVEIAIRNPTAGVGEVWIKSPYLFEGYAEGSSPDTQYDGEYMTVGELGYVDANGHLWLRGRRSRMVTSADQNIYPEAVEQLISIQRGGALCAVIACPDPLRGHVLYAFTEGRYDPAHERILRQKIREQLGKVSEPRQFYYLDTLPQLPSGKTDLKALEAHIPL